MNAEFVWLPRDLDGISNSLGNMDDTTTLGCTERSDPVSRELARLGVRLGGLQGAGGSCRRRPRVVHSSVDPSAKPPKTCIVD